MKFKRRRMYSRMAQKCSHCAGQRRTFGWGNERTRKLMSILKREDDGRLPER